MLRSLGYGLRGQKGETGVGVKGDSGQNGTNGIDGVRGSIWTTGTNTPVATANVGDMYLDTATGDVWRMN